MDLSNQVLYASALGVALPPVISVINRRRWSAHTKAAVAIVACAAAALGVCYYEGALAGADVGRMVMLTIITTKTLYESYYKPSGVGAAIEKGTEA